MSSRYARLPLPSVIDPPNRRCVTLSIPDHEDHWAAFWGVLFELAKAYSWEDDPAHTALDVAQVYRAVYEDARARWDDHECGSVPEAGECFENRPDSPVISWYPQNPYTQPNFAPTGYLNPPWHVVNASDTALLALGFQIGDVQTDLLDFPPGSLPTIIPPGGLPRFQIAFEGTAHPDGVTVELHFVIIPAGGRAVIIDDGQIINPPVEVANMNRDLLAIPPVTSLEVVIERKFLGVGLHTCEAQMFPAVNDEVPFLYFGGGLRKVVICGKDFPNVVAEFRQVGCILEYRPTVASAWLPIYDPIDCIQFIVDQTIEDRLEDGTLSGGQPGPGGDVEPGFCETFQVTLDASGKWICPIPIKASYNIKVEESRGGANGGSVAWYCPNGFTYIIGGCAFSDDPAGAGAPIPADPFMRLVMTYNSAWFDAYNVDHDVSSGLVGSHDLVFQVNDATLTDNAGGYQFKLTICNNQTFGLYEPVPQPSNAVITNTGPLKWHVEVATAFDGAPGFMDYGNLTLYYGRTSPLPVTQLCRRWLVTNLVGWTFDAEHPTFSADDKDCAGGGGLLVGASPIIKNNTCSTIMYSRSATPYSFDIEIVDDCP